MADNMFVKRMLSQRFARHMREMQQQAEQNYGKGIRQKLVESFVDPYMSPPKQEGVQSVPRNFKGRSDLDKLVRHVLVTEYSASDRVSLLSKLKSNRLSEFDKAKIVGGALWNRITQ